MANEYFSIITNVGLIKNAAANSPGGVRVNLSHLAVGDSNGTYYNPVGTATGLKNERYRTTLTHVAIDQDNPTQLIIEAVIKEEVGPFYIREVGVFDASGDLFAIGKYPETFKPDLPAGSGKRLYIRMILGFASSPQVNLIISTDINNDPNFSTTVNNALAARLDKTKNLADLPDITQARANLGLQIGANVQAYSSNLTALAGLSGSLGKIPYFTGATMALADKGYQLKSMQVFTSSGTWTKPEGVNAILVKLVGGGGGGAGASVYNTGGGGGAAGYAESFITSEITATVAVTVGNGGVGGNWSTGFNGGNGSATSFGSYLSALGGIGGITGNGYGGAGNIATISAGIGFTAAGQGGGGVGNFGSGYGDSAPSGGSSMLGGGGVGNRGGVTAANGSNGGGGGGSFAGTGSTNGGNGGSGLVIIYEFV